MSKEKIMIVDNEMEIVQLIKLYLTREGYDTVWTTDSTKAVELAEAEKPDLILLDVVMPDMSGYELCSKIREESTVPVVFISCKGQDIDKVMGLSIGGDDYITKPFSPAELVARVKAHLRRYKLEQRSEADEFHGPKSNTIKVDQILIDMSAHTVTISGKPVHLTAKEFDLLALFCKYPNRVFTSQQIFNSIWDSYGMDDDVRPVMVHISNLRKKIQQATGGPDYIKTVRGVGYKLVSA